MDNKNDYINLHDDNANVGNGPRTMGAIPMPPLPPARKNTALIAVIVVAAVLVFSSIVSAMALGFVFFGRATNHAQIVFAEEIFISPDFAEWDEVWIQEAWAAWYGEI